MQERPLHEIENEKRRIGIASASAHALDSANLGAIFFMTGSVLLHAILESTAKFAMFPFAAALMIFNTVLAWRMAALNKYEGSSVARAIVETVAALAVTVAVTFSIVGAIVLSGAFAIVGPAIFAVILSLKTLANIGFAIYHGVMAARENDPAKKMEHKIKVIESVAGAIFTALAAATVAVVMVFAKPALFFMGVIAGGLGTIMGTAKAIWLACQQPAAPDAGYQAVENKSTTAELQRALEQSSQSRLTNENQTDVSVNNQQIKRSPAMPIHQCNDHERSDTEEFSLFDSTPKEDEKDNLPHHSFSSTP